MHIANVLQRGALLIGALLLPIGSGLADKSPLAPYAVTDLGTLGGFASGAYAINNRGQVVGSSFTVSSNEYSHAFLYTPGVGMQDLGTLGGRWSIATDINESGQVVGYSEVGENDPCGKGTFRAFLYSPGKGMQDLGTLGGCHSAAYAINNRGQIVGNAARFEGDHRAFLYSPGDGMVDLGTFGGTYADAFGINDRGQIVGHAYTEGDPETGPHAFLYTPGRGMEDLYITSGLDGEPLDINNKGQIVGRVNPTDNLFLLSPGGSVQDLGPPGLTLGLTDINNKGQVVFGVNGGLVALPFMYTSDDGIVDLNTLIPPGSGWVLAFPRGINERGQIIGDGLHNGQHAAFLMTPRKL